MLDVNKIDFFKNVDLKHAYDPLTKVFNREIIIKYLYHLIETKTKFTLCLCDVDNFKQINDFYGHMTGDDILSSFASGISKVVGNLGVIGRYGGDEFMLILPEIDEYDKVWELCHNINLELGTFKHEKYTTLSVTTTIGITRCPIDGTTYEQLLQTADKALYRGKEKGRNCFIIYLASKHANIEIKNNREIHDLTTEMISTLFDIMSNDDGTIRSNMEDAVIYLSKYLNIDSISLDSLNKMCYCYINNECNVKEFSFINPKLYDHETNSIGLSYINSRKTLLETNANELFDSLKSDQIMSLLVMRVQMNNNIYGYIVARSTNNRIWQAREMDLFVMVSKMISRVLYYNKTNFDELFKD